jgi:hypothetical protein
MTLRKECRLSVFENRVLRRMFGPKRDDRGGGWRKQHNEELHDLYPSASIIRMIKSMRIGWVGHVAHMREGSNAYKIFVRQAEGNRPPRKT